MEPEMVAFLKRVANSVFIAFAWLGITAVAAIKGDNAFIGDQLRLGNVLFYTWFIISVVLLIWIYKKMWVNR